MNRHGHIRAFSSRRLSRVVAKVMLGVVGWGVGAGCSGLQDHRAVLEMMHAAGRYEQAAADLDDPATQRLYGDNSRVLWELDRGAVALALDDDDTAIELLDRAERRIDQTNEPSTTDELAKWILNDTAAAYVPEPYEDMYVNVLKLLAQLEAGRIVGGATVEARRLSRKADRLRDRYLRYESALNERSGSALANVSRLGPLAAVNEAGRFIESPLGTFLTAVTFMHSGDRQFQQVAGRRLVDSISLQKGLIGPVHAEDFAGLGELSPDEADVLIVALSGRGPTKRAQRFGPVPVGRVPVYFELPVLIGHPSEVTGVRVEIETAEGLQSHRLALVEDLGKVSYENHRQQMPLIATRAILRAAAKSGLAYGAAEAARHSASDNDKDWVALVGLLAGLVAVTATEEADLRCWVFLPGQAHVGLLDLAPGEYRLRIVYLGGGGGDGGGGGGMYATPWRDVVIGGSDGPLKTIVEQYWR